MREANIFKIYEGFYVTEKNENQILNKFKSAPTQNP